VGKRIVLAESPSHKFGQIIGILLEDTIEPILSDFAKKQGLFLDKIGKRPARKGKKVTWQDLYGNSHDLDFVLELGGTPKKIGKPIAFIESAWRRYTKHSRNKVQEIQGALIPLFETYKEQSPFLGAVLAGVFTKGSLDQLNSLGFSILYFTYDEIVKAFSSVGINAKSDENTPDSEFAKKINKWNTLTSTQKNKLKTNLAKICSNKINKFIKELKLAVERKIISVNIFTLHGKSSKTTSISQAINFITKYNEKSNVRGFVRYEIEIHYNNKDLIKADFHDKKQALRFLNTYL